MNQSSYISESLKAAITTHRGNALWCFFKAWEHYLKDDQEMVNALLGDMMTHLRTMWFCEQKLVRGATV